jgi:formylglycine-generating enzyme required for sulfatase activity
MTAWSWGLRRGIAATVVLLFLLSRVPAQVPAGEKLALLIGAGSYDHSQFDDLKYPLRDVEETAKLLIENDFSRVVVLGNGRGTEAGRRRPTLENIRRELATLLERRTKRDTILVALSGHGIQFDGDKDSYFCPADGNPTKPETLLSLTKLQRELDDSGVGVKLLLVDACRNDPSARGKSVGLNSDHLPQLGKGTGVLFSCSPGERSYEHETWGHGAFFFTVLEGMRPDASGVLPADSDGDGEVNFDELSAYVRKMVPQRVAKVYRDATQRPNLVADLSGVIPLVHGPSGGRRVLKPIEPPKPKGPPRDIAAKTVPLKMKLVPAGRFLMGSPETDGVAEAIEKPQHEVTISKPFYLGIHEVTVSQFAEFVRSENYITTAEADGKGGRGFDATRKVIAQKPGYSWRSPSFEQGPDHPVVNVSWEDARAFCAWLAKKEDKPYRLPTEAEWEHACRAGRKTLFSTGEDEDTLKGYANLADQSLRIVYGAVAWRTASWNDEYAYTSPAGVFKPNEYGLHDMHGNVWEWCADPPRAYDRQPRRDPVGTANTDDRVFRGGSWYNQPRVCRAAGRSVKDRTYRAPNIGFRVALTAPETP